MLAKPIRLKTFFYALVKFFVPPLVGALLITIAFTTNMQFDSLTQSLDLPFKAVVKIFLNNLYTFYVYYLLVYIPFFIYLIVLKALGKLGMITVLVSGFVYGLSPILFDSSTTLLNLMLVMITAISGVLCAGCYYWLDSLFKSDIKSQLT